MRQDCMIVGLRVPDGNDGSLLEIEAVPLVKSKKKFTFDELQKKMLDGVSITQITKEVTGERQYRHIIILPREYCSEQNLTLFRSITLDFNTADKERIQGDYVK